MNVQEIISSANESTLTFVSTVQERIVDANKAVASAVTGYLPDVPSWLPTVDSPDVEKLVKDSYAFQAKLLDKQVTFSVALVDAWTPAKTAPSTATKTATTKTAAAKKTAAKKTTTGTAKKTVTKKSAAARTTTADKPGETE